jgi:hypothetical protein
MNRLTLLVESRIRGDVYVRFGGEHLKTHRRNTTGRWVFSLHLTIKNGISKRAALLVEPAKHHFPIEMAEIENVHNDEYRKKWTVIKAQIDKIQSEKEELKEVA